MTTFTVTRSYAAPKDQVFAVLADIGNVHEISPGVVASKRLNKKQGKGAVRHCDFGKGAGIHEEVTSFKKDTTLQFTGIKFWGNPMKKMVATFVFDELDGETTVSCHMDYGMKMGLIMNPLAKGMYKKAMSQMLAGIDDKVSAKAVPITA